MTEDVILHPGLNESDIEIGAHETMTLQLTISHNKNELQSEAAKNGRAR
jgi:HSP20 family molecular chaperone IbpA